jgi:hypothetical protein
MKPQRALNYLAVIESINELESALSALSPLQQLAVDATADSYSEPEAMIELFQGARDRIQRRVDEVRERLNAFYEDTPQSLADEGIDHSQEWRAAA